MIILYIMFLQLIGIFSNILIPSNLPIIAKLVVNIKEKLHASHVVLLHKPTTDFQDIQFLIQLEKIIGYENIPIAIIYTEEHNVDIIRKKTRYSTLLIALTDDSLTQQFFLKLSMSPQAADKWLICLRNVSIDSFFRNIHIPMDYEVMVLKWLNENRVSISEVYHIRRDLPLQLHIITQWNYTSSGFAWPSKSYYERRKNFQNAEIKAVTAIKKNINTGKLTGFYGEVWTALEREMNFRTNFQAVRDRGAYGTLQNGSWSGMMGMLVTREADIAIGGFAMTSERLQAVSFLAPMVEGSVIVYIKKSDLDTSSSQWLLAPFSGGLWIALFTIIIVLSLGLFAIWNVPSHFEKTADIFTPSQSSWLAIFGCFCQQGHSVKLQPQSCRIVYVTSYITGIIAIASYSAVFVSFLTVRHVDLPFTSFQGLMDDGTYKLGMLTHSATLSYFDKSENEFMRKIYVRLIAPEKNILPSSNTEGLDLLCKRKRYAFLCPSITAEQQMPKLLCDIIAIPEANIPASSTMIVNKNSPYRRLINLCVQKMRRAGILKNIQDKTLSTKMKKIEDIRHKSVKIASMVPLMAILAIGTAMSVVVIFIEKQLNKSTNCF